MRFLPLSSTLLAVWALVGYPLTTRAEFSLSSGDYYSANYFSNIITQYDSAGNIVGSYTLPAEYGSQVKGLTFGPDNLLYATTVTDAGFSVIALDGAGNVQQTYSGTVYINGNLSYGKISTDSNYLYVSGQNVLTRFLLGDPSSGTVIYSDNQIYDSVPLPNGNLFVAAAYSVQEITINGALVRTFTLLGGDNSTINDIRGIEYNQATNDLFVTELGHSGSFHNLLRFNAATGAFEKETTFIYGDDIFLTISGALLVGSRIESPTFFDQDLNSLGATLHGGQQMFVTQFVPEPSVFALIALGLAVGIGHAAFRKR